MEPMISFNRAEKENVLRMLDGCVARVCISDDEHEIVRMIGFATLYITELGCNRIRQIREHRYKGHEDFREEDNG